MNNHRQHTVLENLIYAIIWLIVFAAPFLRGSSESSLDWTNVWFYWSVILPFFVIFAVNNYLLIPLLMSRKTRWAYVLSAVVLIFAVFQLKEAVLSHAFTKMSPVRPQTEEMALREHDGSQGQRQEEKINFRPPKPRPANHDGFNSPDGTGHNGKRLKHRWWLVPFFNDWIVAVLIIGFNIAIRMLFKSIRDEKQIKELEKQNLQAELNYLKAQINPHFFMNTLNNIHALIDIDTDKAKEAVIELSKIMRYVLYDANQPYVSLDKEVQFLKNYTYLMSIRYTEQVEINSYYQEALPEAKIPPLLLVTLVENAFKHGISYHKPSFINISLSASGGKLTCTVENSVAIDKVLPGIGLENLRKRLQLIFGTNYTLEIVEDAQHYETTIIIPLQL